MINPALRRLIWREYLAYACIFTLISCMWLYKPGASGLVYAFWLKMAGNMALFSYILFWRKKHLYLAYNLGIGKRKILLFLLLSDTMIAVLLFSLFLWVRPFIMQINLS